MSSRYQIVFCSCPDAASALTLAQQLVEQNLAACVQTLPGLTSVYRWQGKTEQSSEHLLLIKTRKESYLALENAIIALHPYELPEIVAIPIAQGLPGYLDWIDQTMDTPT